MATDNVRSGGEIWQRCLGKIRNGKPNQFGIIEVSQPYASVGESCECACIGFGFLKRSLAQMGQV